MLLQLKDICFERENRKISSADSSKETEAVFPRDIYKESDGGDNFYVA